MNYILFNIVKHETGIKGYWKDDNKVFIDNIELISCNNKKALKHHKTRLFNSGELAILYREGNKAIFEDKKGKQAILNKRLEFKHKKSFSNTQEIKKILDQYNGCTIYNKKGYIIIEVFTK